MSYEEIVGYVEKKAAKADVKKFGDIAVQVDVTGEGEGAFYIAVKGGAIEVMPYEYKDNNAKIVIDSADLIAVVDGKKKLADAQGYVEGDAEKAEALVKAVASKKSETKAAAKSAAKKAEPKKAAAKPAAKKTAKPAEKKAESVKAEEKKAEPAKAAAKPAAKKPAAKKPAAKKPAAKKK